MKAPEKFLLALVAALALLLAGCGGGSNNDGGDGDGDGEDGSMTMTEPPPPVPSPADRAKDYRLAAVDAGNDLDAAVAAAKMAVNGEDGEADGKGGSDGYAGYAGDASASPPSPPRAGMLTARATHGESMTAQENAQKILDAQDAVNAAVMSAKDALMAAQQALTNAMALPAGTAGRMEAVEELEAVIKELEMEITIKDDGMHMLVAKGELKKYDDEVKADVAMVTEQGKYGSGPDKGMGTPADSAATVGERVLAMFDRAARAGLTPTSPPTEFPADMDGVFAMGDTATAAMMTYDQIFATEPIPLDNALVQAVALAGKDVTAGTMGDGNLTMAADRNAGPQDYRYMGIPGHAYCRRDAGCAATDAQNKEVGEGWYFVPTDDDNGGTDGGNNWRTALLSKRGGEGANSEDYVLATYAKYGVWLIGNETADPSTLVLNRYSQSMGVLAPTTALPNTVQGSATYAGTAEGLSVRYGRNEATGVPSGHQSGAFRADVRLTLDFGGERDPAMLSGVVNNFTGVHNAGVVHSGWEVTLDEQPVAMANLPITGVTMSKGPAAVDATGTAWTANPFGSHEYTYEDADGMEQAPVNIAMGYHGAFDARFGNGRVAGVYAAEVEE